MAVKALNFRSSMLSLLPHATFTVSQLKAHPLGAPHVAQFEALKAEGRVVQGHELDHVEAITEAQARVVATDLRLDDFASRFSKAVLTLTADERTSPLYKHYFEKPLGELTRPVLRGQLEAMKKWQVSLAKSPHATLTAMGPELDALIVEADEAMIARDGARQQNREFRDVGERRQWVDRLNATRKEVHGALAKLPYENPGLPSDFADQFFMSDPAREQEEDADTVEALEAQAASLREELTQVEASLAAALATEVELARKEAAKARAAKEAALAELEQAAAELEQERAAMKAQLAAMPV